jgi:cytochrome o ubiquinol oxidase subunit 1
MMNFANLLWLFGHPEVYILILPAFGVYSEIVATFSSKRLYGYTSLVIATMVIALLSFTVWLHHFFTMGQAASVNAVFGITTMLIGIPTGVKIYDWMATMYRGRIRMSVPMIYMIAFMVLFTIGGLSGIILANPTIDYEVHNTLFLVAHFHNMLVPGLLFGMLSGYTYWFPKVFGFRLDERWGRIAAFSWIIGFVLAFLPLYVVGLMGMTRRTVSYTDPAYQPWFILAMVGAAFVAFALAATAIQLFVSIRNREKLRDLTGDPWGARTLEWATPSPVPEYNYASLPHIHAREAFAVAKESGQTQWTPTQFHDIHLPGKTHMGLIMAVFGTLFGFAMVWYMWWLAIVSAGVLVVSLVLRAWRGDRHPIVIPAAHIEAEQRAWAQRLETVPTAS